tara:strand:- start:316 stop:468 length:153 start_codon:yes stop_codon:yes gene_type:complete
MKISLERLINIIKDIQNDDEWVNDSHTKSEYYGGIRAMKIITDQLLEEIK